MKTSLVRLAAAILISVCLSAAPAQVSQRGDGYLFRLGLKKGQKLHYVAPVKIDGLLSKRINLSMHLDVNVLSVSNGTARVKGHLDAGKFEGASLIPSRTITFKVDSRGRVKDETASLGGFTVVFPEFPVKLHRSFVAPVPVLINTQDQNNELSSRDATFTFVGFVGSGAKKAAKLTFVVSGNLAPSGAMLISVKDGTMMRYATKFYLNTNGAKPLVITAAFNRQ